MGLRPSYSQAMRLTLWMIALIAGGSAALATGAYLSGGAPTTMAHTPAR